MKTVCSWLIVQKDPKIISVAIEAFNNILAIDKSKRWKSQFEEAVTFVQAFSHVALLSEKIQQFLQYMKEPSEVHSLVDILVQWICLNDQDKFNLDIYLLN